MGKVIWRVCKAKGKGFGRSIKAKLLEGLCKGEVVIYVVKEAWLAVPPVLHVAFSPSDRNLFRDDSSTELELRGGAVNYAYGLAGPAALDLVHKGVLGQSDGFRRLGCGASCKEQRKCCNKVTELHKL